MQARLSFVKVRRCAHRSWSPEFPFRKFCRAIVRSRSFGAALQSIFNKLTHCTAQLINGEMFIRRQVKQSLRSGRPRTGGVSFRFILEMERTQKTRLFTFPQSNLCFSRHPHARDILRYSAQPSRNLTWYNAWPGDAAERSCVALWIMLGKQYTHHPPPPHTHTRSAAFRLWLFPRIKYSISMPVRWEYWYWHYRHTIWKERREREREREENVWTE